MQRIRWTWPVLGAILLVFQSGCLVVHTSTRVIRENEALRSVGFESEEARSAFESGVNEVKARKKNHDLGVLAVPFLCLLCRATELSDNAVYNDQVALCDANGDNSITEQEAVAFRAQVAQQRRADAAREKESDRPGGDSETVSLRPPE